jgi:hypothetical protein
LDALDGQDYSSDENPSLSRGRNRTVSGQLGSMSASSGLTLREASSLLHDTEDGPYTPSVYTPVRMTWKSVGSMSGEDTCHTGTCEEVLTRVSWIDNDGSGV